MMIDPLIKIVLDNIDDVIGAEAVRAAGGDLNRLKRDVDRALPGLLKIELIPGKNRPDKKPAARIKAVDSTVDELRGVLAGYGTHSPKLRAASAGCQTPRDEAVVAGDPGFTALAGAHLLAPLDRLDFWSNAAHTRLFRQIAHINANNGVYVLPEGLHREDLPAALRDQMERAEGAFAAGAPERGNEQVAITNALPQILIPDESVRGGYLSVTPLPCGPVIAEVSAAIAAIRWPASEGRESAGTETGEKPEAVRRVACAHYLSAASNSQVLSAAVGPARHVLGSLPPTANYRLRVALALGAEPDAQRVGDYVGGTLARLERRRSACAGKAVAHLRKRLPVWQSAKSANTWERQAYRDDLSVIFAALAAELAGALRVLEEHGVACAGLRAWLRSGEGAAVVAHALIHHIERPLGSHSAGVWAEIAGAALAEALPERETDHVG